MSEAAVQGGPGRPLTYLAPAARLPPVGTHLPGSSPASSPHLPALLCSPPACCTLSSELGEDAQRGGGAGEAEGASSPALSDLGELAALITMTTGVGAGRRSHSGEAREPLSRLAGGRNASLPPPTPGVRIPNCQGPYGRLDLALVSWRKETQPTGLLPSGRKSDLYSLCYPQKPG